MRTVVRLEGDIMTNYEKIKAMSVDEMAKFLNNATLDLEHCSCCPAYDICWEISASCETVFEKWLESEVQEDDR